MARNKLRNLISLPRHRSILVISLLVLCNKVVSQSYPDYATTGDGVGGGGDAYSFTNNNVDTNPSVDSQYQNEEFPSGENAPLQTNSGSSSPPSPSQSFSKVLSGSYSGGEGESSHVDKSHGAHGPAAQAISNHNDNPQHSPAFQASPQFDPEEPSGSQYSLSLPNNPYDYSQYGDYNNNVDYVPVEGKEGQNDEFGESAPYNYGDTAPVQHGAENSPPFRLQEPPTFHQPFPINQYSTDYENPFKDGDDDDHHHGLSLLGHGQFGELGKKELIIGFGIFVFVYL
jgi:hypothetical protein